jgi:hypothetical protein
MITNRKIVKEIFFREEGTFQSLYAAQKWLYDNGYSYGSNCAGAPIGILKGEYNIAKWKNLSAAEKNLLHGVMVSDDFREGTIAIKFFEH